MVLSGDASPTGLTQVEAVTMRIASTIVLVTLSAGLQVGDWPIWSIAAAGAGYLAWTVLYAEATVRWRPDRASAKPVANPA